MPLMQAKINPETDPAPAVDHGTAQICAFFLEKRIGQFVPNR